MKTFPLQSLTLIEAQQKQFALVDTICRHFPGAEFLTSGDLGLTPGLNQPRITQRLQTFLVIFRDIQMQGRLNKLLRQRRFRM